MMRAFSRSQVLKAGPKRADIEPPMRIWWTKQRPMEGQVTRSISQHEQQILIPWLKTFPKKTMRRAPAYLIWLGIPTYIFLGSLARAQDKIDAREFLERP